MATTQSSDGEPPSTNLDPDIVKAHAVLQALKENGEYGEERPAREIANEVVYWCQSHGRNIPHEAFNEHHVQGFIELSEDAAAAVLDWVENFHADYLADPEVYLNPVLGAHEPEIGGNLTGAEVELVLDAYADLLVVDAKEVVAEKGRGLKRFDTAKLLTEKLGRDFRLKQYPLSVAEHLGDEQSTNSFRAETLSEARESLVLFATDAIVGAVHSRLQDRLADQ